MLDKLGMHNVSDENVNEILKDVKVKGTDKKGLLTADEFNEIIKRRLA
jgi:Ca2+-binding EF-hand superfamily protein